MSLEEALNRNTEMLERLCSIMGSVPFRAPDPVGRAEKEAESMASFKKEPAPNVESKSSIPESGEQSQQTQESSKPELDYAKDVKPITLKLSKEKGREITIAVLSRFGVKGAQDLDQAQWADYIAHCEKVLAGGEV